MITQAPVPAHTPKQRVTPTHQPSSATCEPTTPEPWVSGLSGPETIMRGTTCALPGVWRRVLGSSTRSSRRSNSRHAGPRRCWWLGCARACSGSTGVAATGGARPAMTPVMAGAGGGVWTRLRGHVRLVGLSCGVVGAAGHHLAVGDPDRGAGGRRAEVSGSAPAKDGWRPPGSVDCGADGRILCGTRPDVDQLERHALRGHFMAVRRCGSGARGNLPRPSRSPCPRAG